VAALWGKYIIILVNLLFVVGGLNEQAALFNNQ
jgi:hypothetical protein